MATEVGCVDRAAVQVTGRRARAERLLQRMGRGAGTEGIRSNACGAFGAKHTWRGATQRASDDK
jgi:hydroxylamine reductase (hybrid-cluster protein)